MKIVRLQDGTVLQFPDEATPEQMQAVVSQRSSQTALSSDTQEASPEESGFFEQFGAGAVRGVTGLGDLAGRADQWLEEKTGLDLSIGDGPPALSQLHETVSEQLPEKDPESWGHYLGELAGPSLVGGGVGAVRGLATQGLTKAGVGQAAKWAGKEAAMVGGGAGGAEVGEWVGGTPGAIIGSLVGSGAAGALPANLAGRAGTRAFARKGLPADQIEATLQSKYGNTLRPEEISDIASNAGYGITPKRVVQAADELAEQVPHMKEFPLTAGMTGNTAVSRVENALGETIPGAIAQTRGGQMPYARVTTAGDEAMRATAQRMRGGDSGNMARSAAQAADDLTIAAEQTAQSAYGSANRRIRGAFDQMENTIEAYTAANPAQGVSVVGLNKALNRVETAQPALKPILKEFRKNMAANVAATRATKPGVKASRTVSYEQMKLAREMLRKHVKDKGVSGNQLRPVYDAMTDAMGEAAERAGIPRAKFDQINKDFAKAIKIDRGKSVDSGELARLKGALGRDSSAPLKAIRQSNYSNVDLLNDIKNNVDDRTWNNLSADIVQSMGKRIGSQGDLKGDFSLETFVTNYDKIPPATKQLLANGDEQVLRNLDNLVIVGKALREKMRTANVSGTAGALSVQRMLSPQNVAYMSTSAGAGLYNALLGLGLLGVNMGISGSLATSKVARALAGDVKSLKEVMYTTGRRAARSVPGLNVAIEEER